MNERISLEIIPSNLHLLEAYVEKIATEFGLQTSFYATILTLTDRLFNDFCTVCEKGKLVISFHQYFDKLELVWSVDSQEQLKKLYAYILDEENPESALYSHVCDSISLINNELSVSFLYNGFNSQLSKRRQDLLRHYLGESPRKTNIYDSLSGN